MAQNTWQDRPNTGSLFAQQEKRSENAPDYTGNIIVGDEVVDHIKKSGGMVKLRIAGWKKTAKTGNVYLSLSVSLDTPKQATPARKGPYNRRNEGNDSPWE